MNRRELIKSMAAAAVPIVALGALPSITLGSEKSPHPREAVIEKCLTTKEGREMKGKGERTKKRAERAMRSDAMSLSLKREINK